jgi:uncharacterized protein YbjQ (UPF0145 family)
MLITTTPTVEGRRITEYLGLVSGEAILGANIFKDFFAGIRDIVGGRSAAYENELRKAKKIAIDEMIESATALGGNAVVGVDLDYETIEGMAAVLHERFGIRCAGLRASLGAVTLHGVDIFIHPVVGAEPLALRGVAGEHLGFALELR